MTYCAAFVTRDAIILTADTVETSTSNDEAGGISSTGDTFFNESTLFDGFEISDSALKIFKIDDKRLVAAAGQKDEIYTAIQFLREHSSKFDFMMPLFESLQSSNNFGLDTVQILCAENAHASLVLGVWSAGRGLSFPANTTDKPAHAILIGSARSGFEYITKNVSQMIAKYPEEKLPHVLTLINSYHQLVGIHVQTTEKKFGGAYTSAAMTRNGIVWQPDTTYYIYSPSELNTEAKKLEAFEAVNVIMRKGLLYVERRTPVFRNILMAPILDLEEVKAIVREIGADLYYTALQLSSDYKVFLSREHPYGVMLHHFHPEYCYKSNIGPDSASATFSPDFYQLLKTRPSLPFLQGAAKLEVVPRGLLADDYVQPVFP